MCGICGIVSRAPIVDRSPTLRMLGQIQHRGPDSTGQFNGTQISLAVQRLSIIDIVHGQQPLYNEDDSLVLIANGEIYNFIELRENLRSRGHEFKSGSDCETILHLYEEFGLDCVHHLRGMFAFALWDQKQRRLLLARDRVGEKPLYIYQSEGSLYFASEMKALLSSGVVPFELNPHAIDLYFHYGYVPEPLTPAKNVRKLPAAHLMIIDTDTWNIVEKRYWSMEDVTPLDADPAGTIRAELEDISKIIIRSDVPVGIALSGGVDSAAIAALVARNYKDQLHAFCVGYPGYPPYDERHEAKMLADHLGIAFHEVELSTEEITAFFPELIFWTDDPIADLSGSAYYAVMKLARAHNVPVMLMGHGGDELFWGYPWVAQAAKETKQKSALVRNQWSEIISEYAELHWPQKWSPWGVRNWVSSCAGLRQAWERFRKHRDSPSDQLVFYDLTPDFKNMWTDRDNFYTPAFLEKLQGTSPYDLFTFPHPWRSIDVRITRLISETYLRENGIAQVDRLSMASSVEARLPLVDYRLIEKVIGLRRKHSDANLPPKTWFKDALKDWIPDSVLQRPKRGFQPPVQEWHRAIFNRHGSHLQEGFLVQAGVLNPEQAFHLAQGDFPKGSNVPLSFKALVLELWCRKFSQLSSGP